MYTILMTLKSQSDLIESTFANERHLIPRA